MFPTHPHEGSVHPKLWAVSVTISSISMSCTAMGDKEKEDTKRDNFCLHPWQRLKTNQHQKWKQLYSMLSPCLRD